MASGRGPCSRQQPAGGPLEEIGDLPLTELALGHTYEAAGQRDSAAQAYTSFLQLWDQADPEYQGRIKEARAALQELSRERP